MPRMTDSSDGGKDIDKETLMKLVTQQMINTLLAGDDEEEDEEAIISALQKKLRDRERARKLKKKARRRNSRERRLSQSDMPPMMPPTPTECLRPGDEIVVGMKDDDSFAGGDLHELVDNTHRRSSGSLPSVASGEELTKTTGASSVGSREALSKSGSAVSQGMSVDEIRQYVMDNIPKAVRDQIPEEAWAQIFNPPSVNTKETTSASAATPISHSQKAPRNAAPRPSSGGGPKSPVLPLDQIEFGDEDAVDDDITVFSDVTGLTGAFPDGKYVEHRREVFTKVAPAAMEIVEEDASQNSRSLKSYRSRDRAPEAPGEGSVRSGISGRNSNTSRIQALDARKKAGVKKVGFDQVQVRYYERIVSDNPSVQSGAAIGIGWKYKRGGRVDIDHWEQSRGPIRSSAELVLPRHIRERILSESGISQKEIAEMVRKTLKVKNQRKQTVTNLPVEGLEETVEKARKRFTQLVTLGRKGGL